LLLGAGVVREAVHLKPQTGGSTIEIENIRPDRVLPAKTQAGKPPFP